MANFMMLFYLSEFDAQGGAVKKKTHTSLKLRISTLAVAAGLALSGLPLVAQAAGLGKVTVFSALGQPLRAEVELIATPEELSSMKAGLASPDAFKTAGLDYATSLLSIRFTLDKRANGQSIIKLSSDRPLNDPFVDMLMELNWASGRLVREYTFLLDPPEIATKAPPPVISAETRSQAKAAVAKPMDSAPAMVPRTSAKPRAVEEGKSESGGTYQVKRGDTLHRIATEHQAEGVSLDQMLVGLFRANKEVFDGGNMNRLQSGKILTMPAKSEVEAISPSEAHKIVVAQAADWNAYRRKLAAAAEKSMPADEAGKQETSGKISAKIEDKAAPASEAKDQVRVSRTEVGKGKPGSAASEDELLAREKALKEANDRLAVLEKNVNELQKLLEMKNQNLAELQKQAGKPSAAEAAKPAPAPVAVVEPAKPVAEQPKPAEPVKMADTPPAAEPPKMAEAAPPVEEKKPEEAKPVEPPKPVAEAPKPPTKPKVVIPPPPPEEPSFVEELMDNPMLLAGGGGILALLLGLVAVKRRRAAAADEEPLAVSSTAGLSQTSLGENSVFRNTGGQSVDTSHTPPQTDFSQAGPGTIDTDEVDPVAEADVYMAYGRDAQAEEILLEAKVKDPKRYAIHLKLLEIYANRQSTKQFETLATELFSETSGVGADWEKAVAMGVKLDPQNPLYGGKGASSADFDADATVIVSAQNVKNTVTMPGQLAQMASAADIAAPELPSEPAPEISARSNDVADLDFDLGGESKAPELDEQPEAVAAIQPDTNAVKPDLVTTVTLPESMIPPADADGALDFDLGGDEASKSSESAADDTVVGLDFDMPEIKVETPAAEDASALDFDLGLDQPAPATGAPAEKPAAEAKEELVLDIGDVDTDALEFDVRLTESTVLGQPMPSSFDMDSINLDLAEPIAETTAKPATVQAPEVNFESSQMETVVNSDLAASLDAESGFEPISENEEVATKLDLAKAYEEMGDLEGARELLQEVLKEGNADQQATAQSILDRVGA